MMHGQQNINILKTVDIKTELIFPLKLYTTSESSRNITVSAVIRLQSGRLRNSGSTPDRDMKFFSTAKAYRTTVKTHDPAIQ
jgi:hypothetical protein